MADSKEEFQPPSYHKMSEQVDEIAEDVKRNPVPKTEPDFSPDVPEHEVPDEHDIPLEEAAKRLDEKEDEKEKEEQK